MICICICDGMYTHSGSERAKVPVDILAIYELLKVPSGGVPLSATDSSSIRNYLTSLSMIIGNEFTLISIVFHLRIHYYPCKYK